MPHQLSRTAGPALLLSKLGPGLILPSLKKRRPTRYPGLDDSISSARVSVRNRSADRCASDLRYKSEYSLVLPEVDSTILFRSLDCFERIRGTNLA